VREVGQRIKHSAVPIQLPNLHVGWGRRPRPLACPPSGHCSVEQRLQCSGIIGACALSCGGVRPGAQGSHRPLVGGATTSCRRRRNSAGSGWAASCGRCSTGRLDRRLFCCSPACSTHCVARNVFSAREAPTTAAEAASPRLRQHLTLDDWMHSMPGRGSHARSCQKHSRQLLIQTNRMLQNLLNQVSRSTHTPAAPSTAHQGCRRHLTPARWRPLTARCRSRRDMLACRLPCWMLLLSCSLRHCHRGSRLLWHFRLSQRSPTRPLRCAARCEQMQRHTPTCLPPPAIIYRDNTNTSTNT